MERIPRREADRLASELIDEAIDDLLRGLGDGSVPHRVEEAPDQCINFFHADCTGSRSFAPGPARHITIIDWLSGFLPHDRSIAQSRPYAELIRHLEARGEVDSPHETLRFILWSALSLWLRLGKPECGKRAPVEHVASGLIMTAGRPTMSRILLAGVDLRTDYVIANERILIRKACQGDADCLRTNTLSEITTMQMFSASVDWSSDHDFWVTKQQCETQAILGALRLTAGCPAQLLQEYHHDRVSASVALSVNHRMGPGSAVFEESDTPAFVKCFEDLYAILSPTYLPIELSPRESHLKVAYLHLRRAMIESETERESIAYSMSSLEALLAGNASSNIGYQLQQRGALILGLAGMPSLRIAQVVKNAYEERSRFYHGSSGDRKPKDGSDLKSRSLDIARLTMQVMFVVERAGMTKREFLIKLDAAAVDATSRRELQDMLSPLPHHSLWRNLSDW